MNNNSIVSKDPVPFTDNIVKRTGQAMGFTDVFGHEKLAEAVMTEESLRPELLQRFDKWRNEYIKKNIPDPDNITEHQLKELHIIRILRLLIAASQWQENSRRYLH